MLSEGERRGEEGENGLSQTECTRSVYPGLTAHTLLVGEGEARKCGAKGTIKQQEEGSTHERHNGGKKTYMPTAAMNQPVSITEHGSKNA